MTAQLTCCMSDAKSRSASVLLVDIARPIACSAAPGVELVYGAYGRVRGLSRMTWQSMQGLREAETSSGRTGWTARLPSAC